jgi:hypothetical protein
LKLAGHRLGWVEVKLTAELIEECCIIGWMDAARRFELAPAVV